MSSTTIIYYTDNSLEPEFEKIIQDYLIKAAEGKRIISVSQKPMDFGDNICVGDIGRSHYSMFYQTLVGAKKAKTKYIALAEHDCLYTNEHFNWIPPDDTVFWYNLEHWFVQWDNKIAGQYSYFRRKAMSQLICNRKLFIEAVEEKLEMLKMGYSIKKGQPGACEPGVCDNRKAFIAQKAELAKLKDIGKTTKYSAQGFKTQLPNLDIRHGGNFSGSRRARQRCWYVPYWGSFHKVMGEVPPGKWYQEATINGVKMPQRRNTDSSQGRWTEFIKPLLPFKGEGRTAVDLGCNAGFYCRQLSDMGFKPIGIEKEITFLRHAHYWESCDPKGVKIIEGDINEYNIPACSLVLMANVHYWLTEEQRQQLINQLRDKVLYVLVIGRHKSVPKHVSKCDSGDLKQLFEGWKVEGEIHGYKHYAVKFKNPDLIEKDTEELFHYQQLAKSSKFLPSYSNLVKEVLAGNELDMEKDDYYQYLVWRRFKHPDRLFRRHYRLIKSVVDNGILEPLTIGRVVGFEYKPNRLVDGDHRYIIARELGIKKLICKVVR